ncbi:MAG: dihydrolipoyl dehydrogenase [Deltaproteobacteria bacterium]|nr:dihydrolipoyl dehydrogenase [Deltaproteobacteria bacterium]
MSDTKAFDLVVIGGGPAGYTGAIRASQLGLKVAIVEKRGTLGGTCLNVGCIPSKALLDSSEHFSMASHGEFAAHGVKVSKVELDLKTMMERKDKVVKGLTDGVAFLMKKNKVTYFDGTGTLLTPTSVEVKLRDGKTDKLDAKKIMLATGSQPVELPFAKFDGKNILSSTEALALGEVPAKLLVIGGGAIGLEMGSVWMRLGSEVTVIEYAPMVCGMSDQGAAKQLLRILEKQGMKFSLSTKVLAVEAGKSGVIVKAEGADGKKQEFVGDKVLVAAGRKPFSEGLGLEKLGIKKDARGMVEVDAHFQTNVPGIYAVGDLIRGPMLAHKAEEEGVAVAEIVSGKPGHVNYDTVPSVIYTWPELAAVGQTEEQVKSSGRPYRVGQFPFMANGRAKAMGSTDGFVKIIADEKTDRVLGVHIVGPRASDVLAEAVVAMEFGASSEDIARSFHGHPTLSETMREAALAVDKRARQG